MAPDEPAAGNAGCGARKGQSESTRTASSGRPTAARLAAPRQPDTARNPRSSQRRGRQQPRRRRIPLLRTLDRGGVARADVNRKPQGRGLSVGENLLRVAVARSVGVAHDIGVGAILVHSRPGAPLPHLLPVRTVAPPSRSVPIVTTTRSTTPSKATTNGQPTTTTRYGRRRMRLPPRTGRDAQRTYPGSILDRRR